MGAPFDPKQKTMRGDEEPFPWDRLGTRKRLYCSFGSQAFFQPRLFRRVFAAAQALELQLIASVGELADDVDFVRNAPEDAILVRYAPQLALLPNVDCVISHGGANSAVETLTFGRPLLLLPLCNDQPLGAVSLRVRSRQLTRRKVWRRRWQGAQRRAPHVALRLRTETRKRDWRSATRSGWPEPRGAAGASARWRAGEDDMTPPAAELALREEARVALAAVPLAGEGHGVAVATAGISRVVSLLGCTALVLETRIVALDSSLPDGPARAARETEIALRELSSEKHLARANHERGFRMEDLLLLALEGPEEALPTLVSWWRRRLLPESTIETRRGAFVRARAAFAERGVVATSQRKTYAPEPSRGDRVRLEAFELHVTEHCNLRCEHCCNSSPYLAHKTLTLDSIARTLPLVSRVAYADVFKIMGGEPLLHPQITDVLRAVKESGVSDVVRLFTNGLLLSKMKDDFWRELDQLTVSTYASAPVRPEQLAHIEHKAREFDVILNVKPVEHFSQVAHDVRREDVAEVEATWRNCWLRHRCLVARDGRFYICTRAAYLEELHQQVALVQPFADARTRRLDDSVALDDPELQAKLLALLNRDLPLHSCQFCLGGDGPREAHAQLSRADVRTADCAGCRCCRERAARTRADPGAERASTHRKAARQRRKRARYRRASRRRVA